MLDEATGKWGIRVSRVGLKSIDPRRPSHEGRPAPQLLYHYLQMLPTWLAATPRRRTRSPTPARSRPPARRAPQRLILQHYRDAGLVSRYLRSPMSPSSE